MIHWRQWIFHRSNPVANVELSLVRNLTSKTDIFAPNTAQKHLDVTNFDQTSLVFHSATPCAVGHQVSLTGQVMMNKKTFKFEATGKIAAVDSDENTNRIEVHLHQFDKQLWKNLLLQIRDDRNRVDKIFKSMKGEDE